MTDMVLLSEPPVQFNSREQHNDGHGNDGLMVVDDCCSFLHLGALAVTDLLFADDSSVVVDEDGNTISSPKPNRHRALRHHLQCPYMITFEKKPNEDDEEGDAFTAVTAVTTFNEDDDGEEDTVFMALEDDDDDDENGGHRSDCENTLTDISAIVASKLTTNCSPRCRSRDDNSMVCGGTTKKANIVVSDNDEDEGSESNILSMDTVPSLFDDAEEEEDDDEGAGEEVSSRKHYHLSHDRNTIQQHKTDNNIPTVITPQRKKKTMRGPYQLKRLVSRGVQKLNPDASASSNNNNNAVNKQIPAATGTTAKPKSMFGATSQRQHYSRKRYVALGGSGGASAEPPTTNNEMIPFDEPNWYK